METNNNAITPDQLTRYRAIYSKSCGTYAGKKDSPDYAFRKREWNTAKKAVKAAVNDAKAKALEINPDAMNAFAKVKPSGTHTAGEKFTPPAGTVLHESMEAERLAYMNDARNILSSGTRNEGALYYLGENKKLDAYIMKAIKQDGMAREPLACHPVQVTTPILTLTDEGDWKADKAAAVRWLAWRNLSIEHYRKEATAIAVASIKAEQARLAKEAKEKAKAEKPKRIRKSAKAQA